MLIDTHRHFGGCIPCEFVWEIVRENDFKHLGESLSDVRAAMQFLPNEPANFHRFLDKFKILDHIVWKVILTIPRGLIPNQLIMNHLFYILDVKKVS